MSEDPACLKLQLLEKIMQPRSGLVKVSLFIWKCVDSKLETVPHLSCKKV